MIVCVDDGRLVLSRSADPRADEETGESRQYNGRGGEGPRGGGQQALEENVSVPGGSGSVYAARGRVLCSGCIRTDNIDFVSLCWVCSVWSMASLCVSGELYCMDMLHPSVSDVFNPPDQAVLLKL